MSEANSRPTRDVLDEATGDLRATSIPAGPPAELTAATVAAIHQRLAGSMARELALKERRRKIMRYIGFGSATAAAVAIATVAGLFWFGGNRAVAFSDVLDRVKKAESVTFVERQRLGDQGEMVVKYSIRGSQLRLDMMAGTVFLYDTKRKVGLMLFPHERGYLRIDKDSPNQIHGPAEGTPFDELLALKDRKPESTVKEKLNGHVVQKMTITGDPNANPPGDWVIWVDPETRLPVRMEYTATSQAGDRQVSVTKVYEQFNWNVKLDDKLFDMTVPNGFRAGLPGQVPPPPEVLFIRSIDRAEKAKSVRVKVSTGKDGNWAENLAIVRQGGRVRMERPDQTLVSDLKSLELLSLDPKAKTARRSKLAAQEAKFIGGIMGGLDALKADLAGGDKAAIVDLGPDMLNGTKTTKYEVKSKQPMMTWTIWIDPKTDLPLRADSVGEGEAKNRIRLDFSKWNEKLDDALFELKIPAGYREVKE